MANPYEGYLLPPGWSVKEVDSLRGVYSVFDEQGVQQCDQGWRPLDAMKAEGHLTAIWRHYFCGPCRGLCAIEYPYKEVMK